MSTLFVRGVVVEMAGEGPDIVCLHGLGGTSNTWLPLLDAMRDHRVIRIDLPGSGRSAEAGGSSPTLSIAEMVEAVANVCDALKIRFATFIGHSMGTIICQHLAVANPTLVRRLVLFGPLMSLSDAARQGVRNRATAALAGGAAAMQEIADMIAEGAIAKATRASRPLCVAFIRESVMRQPAIAYAKTCEALAGVDAVPLGAIRVPVLLVTGEEDLVAPPATARAMGESLRVSSVHVLADCGHWTPLECPAECSALLTAFLDQRGQDQAR